MGNDRIGVSIYKGEKRFLIIPEIRHIGGFSVESQWYKYYRFLQNMKFWVSV